MRSCKGDKLELLFAFDSGIRESFYIILMLFMISKIPYLQINNTIFVNLLNEHIKNVMGSFSDVGIKIISIYINNCAKIAHK